MGLARRRIGASSTGTARLARAGPGGSWMRRPRSSVWTERAAPARTFDGASATRRSGALNTSSRICEDAAVAPGMAEAAESVSRMDRKGRTCADYGKRLCKKRKWCRFDPDGQTCEEKEAGYLRG